MKYSVLPLLICTLASPAASASSVQERFKSNPYSHCILDAARRYQINPDLIDAIIRTESDYDPDAVNINTSGSTDIGLMQINADIWLPTIRALGYDRDSLFDPCVNTTVGAWILAQEVQRFGYNWEAVGAYNAGPSKDREQRRLSYAQRVFNNLNR